MRKITHPESYQFFSRLTSNACLITSTNCRTLVGMHLHFASLLVFRSWMISGEVSSGRATQSKGVTEIMTGSFWPSTIDSIVQEKLCRISKVLEGKTRELCICTQLKLEQLPYGSEKPAAHCHSLGSILLT